MGIAQMSELARAVIYASATGLIVHILGTEIHHGLTAREPLSPNDLWLWSAIALVSTTFIVLDGLARYTLRQASATTTPPRRKSYVPACKFLLEITGLFALACWVCVAALDQDPFGYLSVPLLSLFSFCCLVHNLLQATRAYSYSQGEDMYWHVAAARLLKIYGASLVWKDILEEPTFEKNGNSSGYNQQSCDKLVKKYPFIIGVRRKLFDPERPESLVEHLKVMAYRLAGQICLIHVILMHFALMATGAAIFSYPGIDTDMSFSSAIFPNSGQGMVIVSACIFGVVLVLMLSSLWAASGDEQNRIKRSSTSQITPGSGEVFSTTLFNLSLLFLLSAVLFFLPIIWIYVLYAASMTLVVASTLSFAAEASPSDAVVEPVS